MSENEDKILGVIHAAVEEVNLTLPAEQQVSEELDAGLAEPAGPLDSLGLVNLVVDLEQRIEEEFGVSVDLAEHDEAAAERNRFASIRTLAAYLAERLDATAGDNV